MNNTKSHMSYKSIGSEGNIYPSMTQGKRSRTQSLITIRHRRNNSLNGGGQGGKMPSMLEKTLSNFHTNHLRETIHNNKLYQNLFLTPSSNGYRDYDKNEDEETSPKLTFQTRNHCSHIDLDTMHTMKTYSSLKSKTKESTSKYLTTANYFPIRNKKMKIKRKNYYEGYRMDFTKKDIKYHPEKRIETVADFLIKTREIGREKYINSLQLTAHDKLYQISENYIKQVDLDIFSYSKSSALLSIYSSEFDKYTNYLTNIASKETEVNNSLKEHKLQLTNDIERLKKRQTKIFHAYIENYRTKLFLYLVKNNGSDFDKFSKEDKKEITADQRLLLKIVNENPSAVFGQFFNGRNSIEIIDINKKRPSAIEAIGRSMIKYYSTINNKSYVSLDKNDYYSPSTACINDNEVPSSFNRTDRSMKSSNRNIFNSIEEFIDRVENMTNKNAVLLNKYNKKQEELDVFKKELRILEEEYVIKYQSKELQEIINRVSLVAFNAKSRNEELNTFLVSIPEAKINLKKVGRLIENILTEITMQMSFKELMGNNDYGIKNDPLQYIEKILISLLDMHKSHKEAYPIEYSKARLRLEKEKKKQNTRMLKLQEKLKVMNKNKLIIEKSKKSVLKAYRKVDRPIIVTSIAKSIKSPTKNKSSTYNLEDYL